MALKAARLWMGSLLICTWAASAQAQECVENDDCPKGWSCEASMGAAECDAPVPDCEPGSKCPEPAPCAAPVETRACHPASCATDADCGDGMVCFKDSYTKCSDSAGAPACAPGEECAMPAPPPDEPSCTSEEIALCVPRYLLPCEQDNDCGDGFACVAGEECTCWGSGGAADGGVAGPSMGDGDDVSGFAPVPVDAGTDQPAADAAVGGSDPMCECRPTERKHCELQWMVCRTDADCPSDFACKAYGDSAAVSCMSSDAGEAACAADVAPPAELRCAPRAEFPTRGGSKGEDTASDGPTYEEGDDPSHAGGPDAGVAAPQAPNDGDTGGAAAGDSASCSVTTPRGGALGSFLAPVAFALLALGARTRRKPR